MTDLRIDQLVYEPYEQTDDEIRIVEKATHAFVSLDSYLPGVGNSLLSSTTNQGNSTKSQEVKSRGFGNHGAEEQIIGIADLSAVGWCDRVNLDARHPICFRVLAVSRIADEFSVDRVGVLVEQASLCVEELRQRARVPNPQQTRPSLRLAKDDLVADRDRHRYSHRKETRQWYFQRWGRRLRKLRHGTVRTARRQC